MVDEANKDDSSDIPSIDENFPDLLAALLGSITSPRAALYTLLAYNVGLNLLVLRTKPGYPYPELNTILHALERALGDVVRHGDDDGARHAKQLISDLLKAVERYTKQRKPTRREIVISVIRTPCHALMLDGRSKYFPNYEGIAREVLRSHISREDSIERVSEQRDDVSELAQRLSIELDKYYKEGRLRAGVDPIDVAEAAFKIAGIPSNKIYNALEANKRMKASRARRRS